MNVESTNDGERPDDVKLERLFERPGLPEVDLPALLVEHYGGPFGLARPCVYANFVASVDGVVALPDGGESGKIISGGSRADRFVMGLLRSCADAVIIGAGTFRRSPGALWDAESIDPARATLYAEFRARRRLTPKPPLVLVTGSGDLDVARPAIANAIVATTRAGGDKLRDRLPSTARLWVMDADEVRFGDVVARLHAEGFRSLLCEGGPSLIAEVVAAKLLDELFVTSSPKLFGRFPNDGRKSLTDGRDLGGAPLELASVRRNGSHLFLRYALDRNGATEPRG
ncbi:MAG TPA: dihydrofolate reductase family protein [Polyangiaceae bacterium]|nr:dihydrofolate reductase family protein [Polyangiaceae bacterium]